MIPLIILILTIVLFILFVKLAFKHDSYLCLVFAVLVLIIGSVSACSIHDYFELEKAKKCETWYLDGEEVDKDKINLLLYHFTIDEENGVVYISTR